MDWRAIEAAVSTAGLRLRGGFAPVPADRVPPLADGRAPRALALVGSVGGSLWPAFAASPERADGAADPLDRWSRRILTEIAERLGCAVAFPFGGPPHHPFHAWARKAEPVTPSPVGLLVHPDYGLWHAYRGALIFAEALEIPPRMARASPCESCADRPCLSACPVGAFGETYDVAACLAHLDGPAGGPCYARACLARAACPVGRAHAYDEAQAVFHMTAFRASQRDRGGME